MFKEQIYKEDIAFFMQFLHMEIQFNPLFSPKECKSNFCNSRANFKMKV